ncbi:MAG: HAMP domain-containing histidine kinase [Chloroflexi bacterium]|nr:HAMP domain-containing histidine kinase [Chloroflexota bacterium]
MRFRSLRTRLVAAFVLVIFLSLMVSSSGAVLLLRDYQRQIRLNQLADMALPITYQVSVLERVGASPSQIGSFLQDQARETGVRILLVDSQGKIVEDTQGELGGAGVDPQSYDLIFRRPSPPVKVYRTHNGLVLVTIPPRTSSLQSERFLSRIPSYSVVLAVPQEQITSAWLELAPQFSIAALVSLAASILVAFLLSRSISKPILQIARASEEMAQGHYDQFISVKSRDELGLLASSFNNMARQVSTTNRTLREFLANASHELKTPLTSIQGFSQALVDGAVKDRQGYEEAGRIINDEANRMRRLVDDLLDLSRIESGQSKLDVQPVDLTDLLRDCVRQIRRQANDSGVAISTQVDGCIVIDGDARRLENVFSNLLENAIKYTPDGGTISVRLGLNRRPGADALRHQEATIAVHNTGSVIPADERDKVFDRFYQAKVSPARASEGTGLGLAIVKEIVQAHGGSVSVVSDAASGTEFVVALPAGNAAAG